jgi:hypothetical protein
LNPGIEVGSQNGAPAKGLSLFHIEVDRFGPFLRVPRFHTTRPKRKPSFDLLHSPEYGKEVSLAVFDLLEHDGEDVRKQELLDRKKRSARLLSKVRDGIEFPAHRR